MQNLVEIDAFVLRKIVDWLYKYIVEPPLHMELGLHVVFMTFEQEGTF